ncbi:MAG: ABC transporter permease [Bacteroidaceae bacterium]|nr:ABC transporter permease [Bacteroidaceae bacterium]
MIVSHFHSLWQGLKDTLHIWQLESHIIFHDAGVLIFCLLVPLGYPLLYTVIYNTELMREVPITVVDQNHSALSREFIRKVDASQWVKVVSSAQSEADAQEAIREGRTFGYLLLPGDFSSRLAEGRQAYVGMYADMGGLLYYKGILLAATDASLEMNRDIKIRRAAKFTAEEDQIAAYPVKNEEVTLFNPTQGFASFLIPAVVILIIQQTLLLAIGMAGGTAEEKQEYGELIATSRRSRGTFHIILGRALAYLLIYAVTSAYMTCVVPHLFQLPQLGRGADLLLFLLPYVLACIFFAMTLSILMRHREMSIMVFVVTSVPLLFISGISWPASAIPPFLKGVSWLFPSTFGINGYVRINTMGATLSQVRSEWLGLWAQTIIYFLTAYLSCRVILHRSTRRAAALKG